MHPHTQCTLNLMFRVLITITSSVKKINHATPHSLQTLLGCKVLQFTTQNIHYLIPDLTSTWHTTAVKLKCDEWVTVICHTNLMLWTCQYKNLIHLCFGLDRLFDTLIAIYNSAAQLTIKSLTFHFSNILLSLLAVHLMTSVIAHTIVYWIQW